MEHQSESKLFDMSLLTEADKQQSDDRGRFWRSLNQLADNEEFQSWLSREFPTAASELPPSLSRRRWLQLMGASLALGGLTGCRWEAEEFAPFTSRPQNRVPGEKQYFASSWEFAGVAQPLRLTCVDGRPVKVEGNPAHPHSNGGTSAFDQALLLSLYDPDRSQTPLEKVRGERKVRTWAEFDRRLKQLINDFPYFAVHPAQR